MCKQCCVLLYKAPISFHAPVFYQTSQGTSGEFNSVKRTAVQYLKRKRKLLTSITVFNCPCVSFLPSVRIGLLHSCSLPTTRPSICLVPLRTTSVQYSRILNSILETYTFRRKARIERERAYLRLMARLRR